ncbi:MAG: mevalonate kinase [Nitrososphaera sp.]
MKPASFASAPAKVILFGEHFVVHGSTAILASIERRISAKAALTDEPGRISIISDLGSESMVVGSQESAEDAQRRKTGGLAPLLDLARQIVHEKSGGQVPGIRIHIESHVRSGIGLGSSAASCVATAAAVVSLFGPVDRQRVCRLAMDAEGMVHGTASGADCYVSTFGGLVTYNRNQSMRPLTPGSDLVLLVCNTGIAHSTREEVDKVRKFKERDVANFKSLQDELDDISSKAADALERGDKVGVGRLMGQNQRLLHRLGVSHPKAEEIIKLALSAGALGAKVTGAGGGGAVIALAGSHEEGEKILAAVEQHGYEAFVTGIDTHGLVSE